VELLLTEVTGRSGAALEGEEGLAGAAVLLTEISVSFGGN
jgi:hypothetical protein